MDLTPGARLDPYEILGAIGAGGMGEVHRARHEKLGREVAIKVLPTALAADRVGLARFEREARSASALNGRDDFMVPYEIAQRPFFDMLGAAGEDKRHAVLTEDGG